MTFSVDQGLRTFGSVVRAARRARDLTQAELAEAADVSLAQLALFEKGRNVSLLFFLKVANALNLSLAIDGTAQTRAPHSALDVFELVHLADMFTALVEQLRTFATDAVLPSSERGKLNDAQAVEEFIARHARDEEGFARLAAALETHSSEAAVPRRAKPPTSLPKAAPRRRVRKGEE